jgi:hypothetical protein
MAASTVGDFNFHWTRDSRIRDSNARDRTTTIKSGSFSREQISKHKDREQLHLHSA